jgi:uncharacterized protein YoxC
MSQGTILTITIAALLVALALLVMAVYVIRLVIELRQTAMAARSLILTVEAELQPTLKEVRQTVMELRDLSGQASASMDQVKIFAASLGETGRSIHRVNELVSSVSGSLSHSGLWWTAALAAGKFFYRSMRRKGGDDHGRQ